MLDDKSVTLVNKKKTGTQVEIRAWAGEAQILVILSTTGKVSKPHSKHVLYEDEHIKRWGRPDNIERTMSMNGTAVFLPGDWEEFIQMVKAGEEKLRRTLEARENAKKVARDLTKGSE